MEPERPNVNHSNNEAFVRDKYCWYCHCPKKHKGFNCSKCFRSFHSKCLKRDTKMPSFLNDGDDMLICSVCTSLDEAKGSVDKQTISDLLKQTMTNISANSEFKVLNNVDSIDMANAIDLIEINRKIDSQVYYSFKAFLEDINTIVHNYRCVNSNEQSKIMTNNLVKFCTFEVENMSSCAECYKNMCKKPNKWRTLACSRPHLVLWISLNRSFSYWPVEKGYCFWPAKLISVGRKNVKAILFDDSKFVEIPQSNCFIYSTNEPTPSKSFRIMPNPKDMMNVLEEVKLYEQNVKAKFGHFESKLECVRFEKLDKHMRAMFPEYVGSPLDAQNYYEPIEETNNTDEGDDFDETDISEQSGQYNSNLVNSSRSNDSSEIPTKRSRFSMDSKNGDNLSRNCGLSKVRKDLSKAMKNMMDFTMEQESTNKSQIEVHHQEMEKMKKSIAEYQTKNDDLISRLKVVTLERDQADSNAKIEIAKIKANFELQQKAEKERVADEIEKLKTEHSQKVVEFENKIETAIKEKSHAEAQLKKNADLQEKYNSLAGQLKTVSDERDQAISNSKIEMDRTKAEHAKNISKMHDIRNQQSAAAMSKSEKLKSEKQRISAELEKCKIDHNQKLTEFRDSMETTMKHDKLNLQKNHEKSLVELKEQMKTDHKKELYHIHGQYKAEYARVLDEMGKYKAECDKKINELKLQLQDTIAVKNSGEAKLNQTVKNLQQKAEAKMFEHSWSLFKK